MSADPVDLMLLLNRATHALATEHAAALATVGLSARAFCVLCRASLGEFTQIQLAEQCDLDKTTMVVAVDELEAAGLALRRPSPTDRRARIVAVTAAGQRKLVEGRAIVRRVHDDVLGTLPASQREVFVDALARLAEGRLSAPAGCEGQVRRPRAVAVRNAPH